MAERTAANILTPDELRLLGGLRFAPRRAFSGKTRGERISRKKGISLEFADYRDYAHGDDLRHLDWTILARLDRPTIRTYQDEDDLAVYIALDVSRSMDFGEPTKFEQASRIASALGFVGLVGQDAVYPVAIGASLPPSRVLRGRASYGALGGWVGAQVPSGEIGLAAALKRFSTSSTYRQGLFVLVTDGLDPAVADGLKAVGSRGHEMVVIQVLSDIEIDPDLEGDLRLIDAESGEPVELTAHSQALRQYKANLDRHCASIDEQARRYGGRYLRCTSGQSLGDFLTRDLRRLGVVR